MDRDFDQIGDRAETVDRWEGLGKAYSEGRTLFGDMPVLFDYDNFTIEPWRRVLTRGTISANRRLGEREAVIQPACVDLAYLRPRYSSSGDAVKRSLAETFLWQHWANDREAVDLELFDSDAVVLHQDATTLTLADLFFARGAGGQLLQSAAHAFARKLSTVFASPDLVWLIPDALNDFDLQVARRNINARFAHAEPLPRSVAAVFEHVDHSRIPHAGYQVVIVDSFGGTIYATKLIAGHSSELEERVPTTRGFYWERTPHVQINDTEGPSGPANEIPFFDGDGEWFDEVRHRGSIQSTNGCCAPIRRLAALISASRWPRAQLWVASGCTICNSRLVISHYGATKSRTLNQGQRQARPVPGVLPR
ncbi:MAG: hypothetical protein V9E82_04745 [Candidatus Nanopelagicales bacterium]